MTGKKANFILISTVVLIGLIIALPQTSIAFTGSGSGTEANPYIITNVDLLQEISADLTAWYELGNDIDATATSGWDGGAGFEPIGTAEGRFTGTFDGQGYTIENLYINRGSDNGLFAYTGSGSEIKDVGLENVSVSNGNWFNGGLVGVNSGTVSNCYSTGSISGNYNVGLIVGANYGTVSNCYSTGTVIGGATASNAGGLVGQNSSDGGAIVTNSYSTASVSGQSSIGGLVGFNGGWESATGTITYSYSTGSVSGSSSVGGLVGGNIGGTVSDSYYNQNTSGCSDTGKGIPKTTAEMKQQATFSGWDFVSTWSIEETVTYPYLQCFVTTSAYGSFKVWLEGAYNTGTDEMRTDIHGSIPLTSPYTAAPATVTSVPADVVDWVWVQLRSTESGATEAQRSLFLKKDGTIVDTDGTTAGIPFEVAAGDYYVIVRHRNHLGIMSAGKLTFVSSGGTSVHDFTTASSQSYGTDAIKELETGAYGMYSGEGNNSGIVSIADVTIAIDNRDAVGYETSDYNLSNIVSVADATRSLANRDKTSKIPSQ